MSKTTIEWTQETWNPTVGCDRISPGCANCYAKTLHDKRHKAVHDGAKLPAQYLEPFETLQLMPDRLDAPLRKRKPTTYFVNSVSDLFHEGVPDQFITDVFGIMALAHWHTFQVLTKRPERMRAFLAAGDHGIVRQFMLLQQNGGTSTRPVFRALDIKRRDDVEWRWPLPNVWLGVSVANQHFADERIPLLLQTPAVVRFISAEPLLGPVDLVKVGASPNGPDWHPLIGWKTKYHHKPRTADECAIGVESSSHDAGGKPHPKIDWVIVGGESGHGARPFDVAWARSIVAQCKSAGVPVFVKQLGARAETDSMADLNGHLARGPRWLVLKGKGGDPQEWPEDLRVREFPNG